MTKLRECRKKKNMKLEELALKVGCGSQYLSAIERGALTPSFSLAFRLAKELNKTVDELFGELLEKKNDKK